MKDKERKMEEKRDNDCWFVSVTLDTPANKDKTRLCKVTSEETQ
jgi:hypothetical protein